MTQEQTMTTDKAMELLRQLAGDYKWGACGTQQPAVGVRWCSLAKCEDRAGVLAAFNYCAWISHIDGPKESNGSFYAKNKVLAKEGLAGAWYHVSLCEFFGSETEKNEWLAAQSICRAIRLSSVGAQNRDIFKIANDFFECILPLEQDRQRVRELVDRQDKKAGLHQTPLDPEEDAHCVYVRPHFNLDGSLQATTHGSLRVVWG